jgi:hypothetical protein
LVAAFEAGATTTFARCTGASVHKLFSAATNGADNMSADSNGNVIFGGLAAGNVEQIGIWSGSQLRLMSPNGVSQPSW